MTDLDTSELGGSLDFNLVAGHFMGEAVIVAEQDLGGARYAGWAQFPVYALTDPPLCHYAMQRAVDALRPWREPDRYRHPFPALDLFPRATAAWRWLRSLRKDR